MLYQSFANGVVMIRKLFVGTLVFLVLSVGYNAEAAEVRVLSFSKSAEDLTGDSITKEIRGAFSAKGFGQPAESPEPAMLSELKNRSLVSGESLDEVKGLGIGSELVVMGSYATKGDKVEISARLVSLESGEVIAAATQEGPATSAADTAKKVGETLAGNVSQPPAGAKVETVDVEAVGYGAVRKIALEMAKRAAIEEGVGTVVNVNKVPDFKQVVSKAGAWLRYRVVKEGKEDNKFMVRIAANIDVPSELAAQYPPAAKELSDETGFKPYMERSAKGEVDWARGVLRVVGRAKVAADADAKASLLARRAAVVDAYGRAIEVVSGVRINSDSKVSDAEKKDKSLRMKIEGLVQGGKVVKDTPKGAEGMYEVTLEIPMRGLRGVQSAFLDTLSAPKSFKEEAKAETASAAAPEEEFTGIVIDARGTGLQAGMFPKILDENGEVIADSSASDREVLKAKGQAAFVVGDPGQGDQGWLEERLGTRPIIFKADIGQSYQVASLVPIFISQNQPKLPAGFKKGMMMRQGPKPLKIKGLNSNGPTKVNLLVSTSQADKAKFKQNLAKVFGKCKVVVIMDSQIGGTEGKLQGPAVFELSMR